MDFYLAQILAFGFNWAPEGCLLCDGSILQIQQNSALYSLLGTNFGGNGQQTFGIPDLRGRTIIGQGAGPGLTPRILGNPNGMGGVEQVALTTAQMPAHNHTATFTGTSVTIKANATPGGNSGPSNRGNALGAVTGGNSLYNSTTPDVALNVAGSVTGTVSVDTNGQSAAVSVMQPYTVLNYCIVTQGIYPSRP